MSTIIAIANLKGGIGKTASAYALAEVLSERYAVLLVDTDTQESLTETVGGNIPNLIFRQALTKGQLTRLLASSPEDIVIIDTPPSIEGITTHVLYAADGVIIPLVPETPDIRGLRQFLAELKAGPQTEIIGILPTRYEPRLIHHQSAIKTIKDAGLPLFKTSIGKSVVFGEAAGNNQSVITYAPKHKQALAYRELASEVEAWLSKRK